jgi:predicted O-methyltransferase YrrM
MLARSKLETVAWFVARPQLYRELGRRLVGLRIRTQRSLRTEAVERRAGMEWCVENRRPLVEILHELGVPAEVVPLAERHPEAWQRAEAEFLRCGGKMGGPAETALLHHLVLHKRPENVVETGVAAGWSSLSILTALESNGRGHLWSVDMPYPKRDAETLVGCVVPDALRERWTLFRLPDRDALPQIVRRTRVALAHYDSDKSYEGRIFGYRILFEALEPGGLLISDDIEDNLAFRDFAISVGREPWVVAKSADNFAGLLVR